MFKAIKFNIDFLEELSDQQLDQLLNYPFALPHDIFNALRFSNPKFNRKISEKWENNKDNFELYEKQRVELNRLSVEEFVNKTYQEDMEFFNKFPQFNNMIDEIINLEKG